MTAPAPQSGRQPAGQEQMPGDALVEALVERLQPALFEAATVAVCGQLISAPAAAKLLDVPETWLRAEARAGRVPHVRLGAKPYVRFDPVELMAWARGRSLGPRTGSHPVSKLREAA